MANDNKSTYWPVIIAVLLLVMFRVFTDGSMRGFLVFMGVVWLLLGVLWLVTVWMKDRAIRFLLRLDSEGRKLALAEIGDEEIQREIVEGLEEEPVSQAPPPVERFPFPRRMTRDLVITYGIGTVVAISGVILAARTSSPDLRVTAAATALVAAVSTIVVGLERSKLLASAIEISPFAISQVWPDGDRHTMFWRDVWWLRNRPWLGRVELLSADRRSGIHVHYDRVAFQRAVELILDYGGFRPPAASQT